MALMYMITQGTKVSGQYKRYKTALDASYGGVEIIAKDMFPYILKNYSSSGIATDLTANFGAVSPVVNTAQNCLRTKLTTITANWPSVCDNTPQAAKNPDLTITLQAAAGNPFLVYSKIVDTTVGNTNIGGLQLEGAGVAESQSVLTPQHFPYIYRLEVQGQRQNNTNAQANIEVLYAY